MYTDIWPQVSGTERILRKRVTTRDHHCVAGETRANGAAAIRAQRKELDLTQAQLAEKAEVGLSSVQRLEKGQRIDPSVEAKVARALLWTPLSIEIVFAGEQPVLLSEEAAQERAWGESFVDEVLAMTHAQMASRAAWFAGVLGDPVEGDKAMAAMLRIRAEHREQRSDTGS